MSEAGRLKKLRGDELERLLWALEYYTVQDNLTFDLENEIKDEIKKRIKNEMNRRKLNA